LRDEAGARRERARPTGRRAAVAAEKRRAWSKVAEPCPVWEEPDREMGRKSALKSALKSARSWARKSEPAPGSEPGLEPGPAPEAALGLGPRRGPGREARVEPERGWRGRR